MAGRQSDQLVIQGELTEQELAELLAQQSDGVEGGAQIVDADGNVVTVSVEQLAAAGIDIDNMNELTEDQLGSLLALANQGPPATGMHTPKAESNHHQAQSHSHSHQPQFQRQRNEPPQPSQPIPDEPSDVDNSSDSLTMVIGEDGSLKLSDGSGQEFVLSADQLASSNIDVNNLTDDQIQQIVQMAMPNFDMAKDQEPPSKRSKMSNEFNESTSLSFDQNMSGGMEGLGRRAGSIGKLGPRSGSFSLIGQEVEVKKSGKNLPATIRYCRHGAGYKVQFDDGHFEWVSEEQIELRSPTAKARSDHESYSGNGEHEATTSRNGLGAGGIGRRVPPAIPGIKVTSQLSDKDVEPNFCCPICDQKVYQKEPAYIVIRLPACESCADSKILVLDQGDSAGPEATANQQQQPSAESTAETHSSPSAELQHS